MTALVADVGGTNTRCAITDGGPPGELRRFRNRDFADLGALLSSYLDSLPTAARPDSGLLAIAAPIAGDEVQMTNIGWRFSLAGLATRLGLRRLDALNDFEALAFALPGFAGDELVPVGGGQGRAGAPKLVLGPGTGLGVATLVPVGSGWHAVRGEGGHVTLAAADDAEAALIAAARQRHGHCSAERLVSGPGLVLLHELLHGEALTGAAALGRRIEQDEPAALATLEQMFRFLGTVAANAALTVGARGGVYVGGGIVPRYAERFQRSGFRARFEAKGRYGDYLGAIPTRLIVAAQPTLAGLAARVRSLAAAGPAAV